MNNVCKKHQKEPVTIYGKCVGCEIVYYQTKNSELMTQIRGEIEVSEQVVQEREELILENERLREALEYTRIGIGNGWEFGYLKETDEGDLQMMLDRINNALKGDETK